MQEKTQTPESGSVSNGLTSPYDLSMTGIERVVAVIARKVDAIEQTVAQIKADKILKDTQLPPELLEQLGLPVTPPKRLKRGRGYRPIMKHEILEAKEVLKSRKGDAVNEAMVARFMGISYDSYKKYAKMHGVWDPKPLIKGRKGVPDPERGKHPLSEILAGKHPNYPVFRIKQKLINGKIKEEKCEICGFNEKRITDGKVPLILNFLDDNPKNHSLENMKLLCYNHTFTGGRGYIRSGQHYFDPDWIQGAEKDMLDNNIEK